MDPTEPRRGASDEVDSDSDHSPASPENPQELPDDLPKSLDDRRSVPVFQQETEMYDAWQGKLAHSRHRGIPHVSTIPGGIPTSSSARLTGTTLDNGIQDSLNSSLHPLLRNPWLLVSPSTTTRTTRNTMLAHAI